MDVNNQYDYYVNNSNNVNGNMSGNYNNGNTGNRNSYKKPNIFGMMLITSIISVLIGAGGLLLVFHFYPDLVRSTITNINKTEKEVTVTDAGIADAVEKVYHSVVVVKTYKRNQLYATGTGFVYKQNDGKYYLLTNYHVIENGDRVGVLFTNGTEEKVVVENGDKYADIAVLSLETNDELSVAVMGKTSDMRVGDTVFAIGAPLDSAIYSWSVTRGILSGKDREVEVSTNNTNTSDWIMQVLQTDAAINSGNSGGPLCNSNGEVIGITNMKLVTSGVEGMGFAIPIEEASSYADSIIDGKDISRPVIGITMVDASSDYAVKMYGIKKQEGVLLEDVEKNSAADKAGLVKGDIIISMNNVKITNVASLRYQLYKYKVGDSVEIKYIRNGNTKSTKLLLLPNK